MTSNDQIFSRLVRAFGDGVEHEIATVLFDFLKLHSDTSHINLPLMRQLTPGAGSGTRDREILRTLQFLAGDAVGFLDAKFEIFDDLDHPHPIATNAVRDAINYKLNPLTGELDPDVAQKITVFFTPVTGSNDRRALDE
jgi:hypothetical protein